VQHENFDTGIMKHLSFIKLIVSAIGLVVSSSYLFSRVVISEKTSIHIDIADKNVASIQLLQPEILVGKTAVFKEPTIKVFGRLVNGKGGEKVIINNIQGVGDEGGDFVFVLKKQ
jgi:hypothetical protein